MLQYANDTLFFCEVTKENIFVLKSIIRCFELASGLKVNYSKRRLGGKSVDTTTIRRYATIMNCDTMTTPFTYLDMLVGGIIGK